jgi:hypothetical protein
MTNIAKWAAASLLIAAAFGTPAHAKPFQQYLNGVCGGTATLCKINFVKVPAGQRMTINNMSCYMRLTNGANGFAPAIRAAQILVLGVNPANVRNAVTLVPQPVGKAGAETVFSANHTVSAFANANERMQAYVELSIGSFSQVACHISGDVSKAT